jgi:intergrase/recombinase
MDSRTQLNMLFNEGKVWDKVKKVWRDHKTGIIVSGLLATSLATKIAIKSKRSKNNSVYIPPKDEKKPGETVMQHLQRVKKQHDS